MNSHVPSSDESSCLLDRARTGDDSALWRLTEQLRPYLKAVVRHDIGHDLAGKVDDSDIVQQSMVRAVNKFGDFDGASVAQWQAWLIAIAHNEARNTVRFWHQQRRDAYRERGKSGSQSNWEPMGDQSSPSQIAMRRERAAKLMFTIQQLPEDQQRLIHGRHFENLSHGVIAERLGITEAAARQRWKSVLEKLNRLWERAQ